MSDFYTWDTNRDVIVALIHALRKNGIPDGVEVQNAMKWLKQDYGIVEIDKDGNYIKED